MNLGLPVDNRCSLREDQCSERCYHLALPCYSNESASVVGVLFKYAMTLQKSFMRIKKDIFKYTNDSRLILEESKLKNSVPNTLLLRNLWLSVIVFFLISKFQALQCCRKKEKKKKLK